MKMMTCIVASILLMLSLEASLLVAGRPSVADDVGSILLPSQGKGGGGGAGADEEFQAAAVNRGRQPWKCCDQPICSGWKYPVCECADEVDECAPTCKSCVPSEANATRKVCEDTFIGKAGPGCTEKPWKCCDEPFCSGEDPPTCHCADEVEQCAPTCKTCLPALLHP
uniref:Bowman-Birk type trypsin inhibitor n=1 Tax=Aegilops tauschii TaxID=37682 RepID=R7WA76_AEGTA